MKKTHKNGKARSKQLPNPPKAKLSFSPPGKVGKPFSNEKKPMKQVRPGLMRECSFAEYFSSVAP